MVHLLIYFFSLIFFSSRSIILSICTCFACGIFFATCFLGLIPHIRAHETKIHFMILVGFSLILFLEQVFNFYLSFIFKFLCYKFQGHGTHSLRIPINFSHQFFHSCALLFGLCSHSIFEGIALGMQNNEKEFFKLLIAIMLHELLCSFAYGVSLAEQQASFGAAFIFTAILASNIPLGILMDTSEVLWCRFFLESFATGTFIYVASVEMLSEELQAKFTNIPLVHIYKAIAFCFGCIFFCFISLSFFY
ncbi:unnamed protein product [Dracunculus medinensis]|uniref:Zinc transporter ZIP1 n=1 Tax=Dracunculus medinensis TaxID=318479 RepID=A0A0N4UI73_DRAME|nr:unnamed protein product [Dracunculus medinensis]